MSLSSIPERFTAILRAVKQRRAKSLAEDITMTDWAREPRFSGVDEFLKFPDAFVTQSVPFRRGPRRRR
jgi:hypothetical protein